MQLKVTASVRDEFFHPHQKELAIDWVRDQLKKSIVMLEKDKGYHFFTGWSVEAIEQYYRKVTAKDRQHPLVRIWSVADLEGVKCES
jgi:hypothetical protein